MVVQGLTLGDTRRLQHGLKRLGDTNASTNVPNAITLLYMALQATLLNDQRGHVAQLAAAGHLPLNDFQYFAVSLLKGLQGFALPVIRGIAGALV